MRRQPATSQGDRPQEKPPCQHLDLDLRHLVSRNMKKLISIVQVLSLWYLVMVILPKSAFISWSESLKDLKFRKRVEKNCNIPNKGLLFTIYKELLQTNKKVNS